MFGSVLDNSCTNVWLFVREYFNEIEICTKLGSKIGVWYCRKEMVLWCGCERKIIIVFIGKCAILEDLGFKRI